MPVIAHRRPNRGFTAVEISMVVTVIAILALLILPLFQRQTDEARITAAQGDIREMAIAMQLANANTGFYFTLSALDNTDFFDAAAVDAAEHVPIVTWNTALQPAQHAAISENWKGPYASYQRIARASDLPDFWFRPNNQAGGTGSSGVNDGPINQQYNGSVNVTTNFSTDRIPLDPWGNPYLFYGPDYYHIPGGAAGETRFRNSLFLSLGPNGVPGDELTFNSGDLRREQGIVGQGDDIFRIM